MSSFLSRISKSMLFGTSIVAAASSALASVPETVNCTDASDSVLVARNTNSEVGRANQEDLKTLTDSWKEVSKKRAEVVAEIRKIQAKAPTPELRKQFQELVGQYTKLAKSQDTLRSKITPALAKSFTASQKIDKETTEMGLEISQLALMSDDYGNAMSVLRPLIEKGTLPKNEKARASVYQMAVSAAAGLDDYKQAKVYMASALNETDRGYETAMKEMDNRIQLMEKENAIRAKEAAANNLPRVQMETSEGTVVIELFENQAPNTVANFVNLVEKGFYNGLKFHRVLPQFMAQGGCPKGTGTGGPGYNIDCECYRPDYRRHFSGTLSMAHAGKNTGGSQFFITFGATPHLDGKHTAFGRVIQGKDVLAKLTRINPGRRAPGVVPSKIVTAKVVRKRKHDYQPKTTPEKK